MPDHAHMQSRLKLLLSALMALAAGLAVAAEPSRPEASATRERLQPPKMVIASPITDRMAVRVLYLMTDVANQIRYDSDAGVLGTLIDGEQVLGFPRRVQQPGLDLTFRMGKRHRIHADFLQLKRSGDAVVGPTEIRFGEATFLPGERVLSRMDLRKVGINWSWSALRKERVELGVGLGLNLMQLQGELNGSAPRFERERLDAAGPVPTLTVDATWRITRRFALNLAGNYLGGNIDGVDGKYQSLHGDVQFRLRPNFALGLGYSQTQIRVDSATTDFSGYFNMKYKGPEAFLRASF
jgi:hypothetical protein